MAVTLLKQFPPCLELIGLVKHIKYAHWANKGGERSKPIFPRPIEKTNKSDFLHFHLNPIVFLDKWKLTFKIQFFKVKMFFFLPALCSWFYKLTELFCFFVCSCFKLREINILKQSLNKSNSLEVHLLLINNEDIKERRISRSALVPESDIL